MKTKHFLVSSCWPFDGIVGRIIEEGFLSSVPVPQSFTIVILSTLGQFLEFLMEMG